MKRQAVSPFVCAEGCALRILFWGVMLMEYYYAIVLVLIAATGYILSIKK